MKKIATNVSMLLLILLMFTGCSEKQLIDEQLESNNIDKVQVITAMGNPEYGVDSKNITDTKEIELFVDTFNSGIIGDKVDDADISDVAASSYYFYFNDGSYKRFTFNGNDTNIIWHDNNYYYVDYDENLKTPFELYDYSNAEVIVVDEKGDEIK
ncbi:hypothetical protein PRVXH_002160 [Proteinivorax hydrogeniformans]|uniref:Lipoprotein n=1 Tax=Proteinivorax hydrogeniformans TaxID=1826727 RepID=A0AAU8HRL8_9FIRM